MALSLNKFGEFQKAQRATQEAQEWIGHIGARGRESDVLSISVAHCSIKLTIAGQYTAGGTNYRESPASLNGALLRVICKRREELLAEAVALLKAEEAEKLVAAKSEVAAINEALEIAA